MNPAAVVQILSRSPRFAKAQPLTVAPPIAWPTVFVMLGSLSIIVAMDVLGVLGAVPLWVGCLTNGLAGYWMFTPAHDAFHHAVARNRRLNDAVGKWALFAISPMVSMHLFRWGHFMHHRNATGEIDPDRWTFLGPKALLPLRWAFIDVGYLLYSIRSTDELARKYLRKTYVASAATLAVIALFCGLGYGLHVFLLWFVPTRITFTLLGFAFFYLPHNPHDVTQEENATRATTLRMGSEWLLTPVLQFHNYHMIHHLFPSTPFYNIIRVWQILEPDFRTFDLAIQHHFALNPAIIEGSKGLSNVAIA